MSRELFLSLSREVTKPERKLFEVDPKGYYYNIHRKAYNDSNFQTYFYFVGQLIGMACYHGKLLEAHFSPIIYRVGLFWSCLIFKCLLGESINLSHLIYIDEHVHSGLEAIRDADDVDDWDLTFVITEEKVRSISILINR